MKFRWGLYLLIGFFSLAALSATISAVTGAQSREADDDDDDDVLEHAPPRGVELRVFIHRPRVIKPNHLGTCTETSDDQVNDFAVTPRHLSGPIIWRLNRSTVPTNLAGSVDGVLNASFNTWCPWAIFPNSPDCQSSPDAYDLQNIATHEIGHWIGLNDLFDDSDKDLTMYGFGAGGEVKKRTLGQGDISGKNELVP